MPTRLSNGLLRLIIGAVLSVFLVAAEGSSMSLSGFNYRKSIPITGSAGAGTGYTMPTLTAHYDDYYITGRGDGYVIHPYCQPVAAYYNGRTYKVFQGPQTTGDGDPYITYYDHSTGKWAAPVKIATNPLPADDRHGAPCILIRTDSGHVGKILVLFGGHGSYNIKWVESTNAEDISSWGTPANVGQGSFPKLVQISGGDIYCFYRPYSAGDMRHWGYQKMASGGSTWGAEVDLLDWSAGGGDVNSEIVAAQYAYDTTNGLIYMTIAQYDVPWFHDQWVFAFKPADGKVYDVDGNDFALPVSKADFDSGSYKFKIYTITGSERTMPGAIALDSSNYPHVVFGTYDGTSTYYQQYTLWNGSAWSSPQVIRGGSDASVEASPGAIILNATDDIDLFLCGSNLDMEEWNFNGSSWGKTQTVLAVSNESAAGITNLCFASIPVNCTSPIRVVFAGRSADYEDERLYAYGAADFISFSAPGFVTLDAKGQSDFGDIRFTDDDGDTLLSYWIESSVEYSYALIRVKVNDNLDSNQSIYCYYNNETAESQSSKADTFMAYDDFERGNDEDALDGDWLSVTGVYIDTAQKEQGTRSARWDGVTGTSPSAYLPVGEAIDNMKILIWLYKLTATDSMQINIGDGSKRVRLRIQDDEKIYYYDGAAYQDTGETITASTWELLEILNFDFTAGTFDISVNGGAAANCAMYNNAGAPNTLYITGDPTNNYDFWLDDIEVQKWVATEPAWNLPGDEEYCVLPDGKYLLIDNTLVKQYCNYLLVDNDLRNQKTPFLMTYSELVNQRSRFMEIIAPFTVYQSAPYIPFINTMVPRIPKPIAGNWFQRFRSVKGSSI